jgi:hypothetical protein
LHRFRESQKQCLCAKERGKVALWQVKKVMHGHFTSLSAALDSLSDTRKGGQYSIEELLMAGTVLFVLKCDSRNSFNHKYKDEQFRANYYRMFRLNLPHMDAVNDLLTKLESKELEDIRCILVTKLIEKRVFHKFRFCGQDFCIAVDGTGTYNWGESPPDDIDKYALKKELSSGRTVRSSMVLEAALVCNNGMSIPLVSEWIANDGQGYDKQDCELNAFKRLSVRLKYYFPRLPVCILADGLYTNIALMDICHDYGWKFITVFRNGNLPSVWKEVDSLLRLENNMKEVICSESNWWYTYRYRYLKDIEYQKYKINWMECVQEKQHRTTGEKVENSFVFLTNMNVNQLNIVSLMKAGRSRWAIEDHFNTQKNRGGALHHKFNRINFNALKNWHNLRQLACMIHELVEHTQEMANLMKENSAKMTMKELWSNLNSYLLMCTAEDIIEQFEHWSKSPRQVRLE